MVKNRLAELQASSKYVKPSPGEVANGDEGADDRYAHGLEQPEALPLRHLDKDLSESTANFFETFDENVVNKIDQVKRNVLEVQRLQKKILNATHRDAGDENCMNDLVAENKRLSIQIRNTLKSEQQRIDDKLSKQYTSPVKKWANQKRSEERAKKRRTELRMRQTQVNSQAKRFFDIWSEYNSSQVDFRDKSKHLLVRRCKIVNESFSDEQIEQMLDEGNTAVFSASILDQERVARQQLTELQNRHDEFIKLERSIKEMHDMFMELASLVTQQGEMVDNIFHNVAKAEVNVEQGRSHLQKAERYAISARKKKLICAAIGVVALLIIVLVVLVELGAFQWSGGSGDAAASLPSKEIVYVYVNSTPPTPTQADLTSSSTEFVEKLIAAAP